MRTKKITLQQVESYLSDKLPEKLQKDLLKLKMMKEADLEGCMFYYLRSYLKGDNNWRVFLRKHSIHTEHFIDILVFRKHIPRISIELKWNRKKISLKDRVSLDMSLSNLGVNKAYFISTLIGAKDYQKIIKTELENHRLMEIVIPLKLSGLKLRQWKKERELYRSKMNLGRKAIAP